MLNQVEQALFDRLIRREAEALNELVREHQTALYRFILRMVNDQADAQDILQDTFVRVWEKIRSFKGNASLKTWVFRIAMNLSYTHLKRRRRWVALESLTHRTMDPGPAEETELKFRKDRLADALDTLTPRQRAVVVARIYQDLPFQEVARAVGCSVNAAKVHFHDGKKRLETYFKERVGIDND
ncbi:MAG: RNA polymerase sigma factor [Candidatus Marinimicrobia bacterium]|nr:RNA polymerase sigma factor [Candidatus Neomarinimicrobiota bacterium]MCF7839921.1 RNA polymerase sigma factor [Candidatus Neomarinimicrobiota bacterium]MCF7902000.1 RNA polymerase sigma factor [Candidatus Neomarinimicrobiota bacterium]